MDEKKFAIFQGHKMIEGWPEKTIKAQKQPAYWINGDQFARIPYGNETDDWEVDKYPCHDCRAIRGQYHAMGCDVEQCPSCADSPSHTTVRTGHVYSGSADQAGQGPRRNKPICMHMMPFFWIVRLDKKLHCLL